MSALIDALRVLASGTDLTEDSACDAVGEALDGQASDVGVAALLTALRLKGETAAELAGAVMAVRARMDLTGLSLPSSGLLDTCGTGGDGAHTVNISTAAAIIVAACGVAVAKHGNRAASGNSGSSEVLAELGIVVDPPRRVVNHCLAELGIAFLFAPSYHPGLKPIGTVRRQLPFRTLMNLVGPLANPARPDFQLVGVAGEGQARLVAEALARLGIRRAAVVTGEGGLDEVTLDGVTRALIVEGGEIREVKWVAADFGLRPVPTIELRVSGPSDSAGRIMHVLAGEPGPIRDTVIANAAAALWVIGQGDMERAVARAQEAVDSGRASSLVQKWRALSHETP